MSNSIELELNSSDFGESCKSFKMWWPGTESNRRRQPFQGCALPSELPGHGARETRWKALCLRNYSNRCADLPPRLTRFDVRGRCSIAEISGRDSHKR